MTDNDSREVDIPFCSGSHFPVTCIQYGNGELGEVLDQMQLEGNYYNPVFVSEGDHKDLIKALNNKSPLSFAKNRVWVMSLENAPIMQLRLDNNILFYDHLPSGGFGVYESYSIKGGSPTTSQLFEWRAGENQRNYDKRPINLLERRSNLNRVVLKNVFKYNRKGSNTDLLSELQDQLSFTIQSVEQNKSISWGHKLKNGTWNGLTGLLVDRKIDLTASWMGIFAQKADVVDYCWATQVEPITLFAYKTSKAKINVMAYANVFPVSVLLIGLVFLVMAAICLSVSSKINIWESFTMMLLLLLQIGYDMTAKNRASKTVLLVAALYTNLFFIYYSSDMTAKMTSEPPRLNIRSFGDVEIGGYKVMPDGFGRMAYTVLKNAPIGSAMRRIFDNEDLVIPNDMADLVQKFRTNSRILIFAPGGSKFCTDKLKIDCIPLDIEDKFKFFKAMTFQKDSEFTALFNHHILRMQESGKIAAIRQRRLGQNDKDYEMSEAIVLGYNNVLFPYALPALGVVISVILAVGEAIVKTLSRSLH